MSTLRIIRGNECDSKFAIDDGVYMVGRSSRCEIQLTDAEVSRRHCQLIAKGDVVVLTECGSSNGTLLNGDALQGRAVIKNGDEVQLGQTVLRFEVGVAAKKPAWNATTQSHGGVSEQPSNDTHCSETCSMSVSETIDTYETTGLPNSYSFMFDPALMDDNEDDFSDAGNSGDCLEPVSTLEVLSGFQRKSLISGNSRENIQGTIDEVLNILHEWISPDRALVLIREDEESPLQIVGTRFRNEELENAPQPISQSVVGHVTRQGQGVLSCNPLNDARWDGNGSILRLGIGEVICVPIRTSTETIGVIYLDNLLAVQEESGQTPFVEEHLKLAMTLANQTAVTLENAKLYQSLIEEKKLAIVGLATRFLGHQIKNFMQSINGGSQLIDDGLEQKEIETIDHGWKIVQRNQSHLSRLMLDLLVLGDAYKPRRSRGKMNDVIKDVIKEIRPSARAAGVSLKFADCDESIVLKFDDDGIRKSIGNLIHFALTACELSGPLQSPKLDMLADSRESYAGAVTMESLPQVLVSIGLQNDQCQITVRISRCIESVLSIEEDLYSPFTTFIANGGYQASTIGLAVCQKIVIGHRGTATVQPHGNAGRLFRVTFPAQRKKATAH